MTPPTREDLELYVMGEHDDAAAIEAALDGDPAARATVAAEARLETLLRDAAAAAAFCPGCRDLVRGERCDACGAALRPGGYTVERVLVGNAHGRMYAARDADGRRVALKELAFVQSPPLAAIAAFEREAKLLRALEHPAIPRFVASFQEGEGVHVRYYLAQELVLGESLEDRLRDHWFTEAEITDIARQVLEVIAYLQRLSPLVIHRDIKPANLLVRPDGSIAVVDFGAAHIHGATAGLTTIGTFGYMPVEQLAGLVDATTDPYALGASIVHLLTRREPWRLLQGSPLEEINASPAFRAFLGKLVAPEPRDRFAGAVAALEALEAVATGESVAVVAVVAAKKKASPPPAKQRWPHPRRALLASAFAAAAGGLALVGTGALDSGETLATHALVETAMPAVPPAPAAPPTTPGRERHFAQMAALRDEICRCAPGDHACGERVRAKINSQPQPAPEDAPTPADKDRVMALLRDTTRCLSDAVSPAAALRLSLPPGVPAKLYVDDALVSFEPGRDVPIATGRHTVKVVGPGAEACQREAMFVAGETIAMACDLPRTPRPGPAVQAITPAVLEQHRTGGTAQIPPDDATRAAIDRAGGRARGIFKVCVDQAGAVATVNIMKSTGHPAYDAKLGREMTAWTFRPFQEDGAPTEICTVVFHAYPPIRE